MRRFVFGLGLVVTSVLAASSPTRFAIIGDYGVDNSNEQAVADLVKTNFQPEFIVTVGDNNYLGAANIDDAIGKYYHDFIGNYSGGYGAGASSNRFFPALGNHDWDSTTGFSAYTNYFTLPESERYYDFVRGPVHFFILNSDSHEPDGNTAASTQALWFSNRIAASASPWRVVIAQCPPYSSSGSATFMRWPFEQWGASVVVSGDAHNYERIMLNGFPYVVNGAGGATPSGFGTPVSGSVVRYNADHGAMLVTASTTNIVYEFWSVGGGGTRIDRFSQVMFPKISIVRTNANVRLSWPTNITSGFVLQSALTLNNPMWTNVTQTPSVSGNRYVLTVPTNTARAFFRLAQ